LIRAKPCSLQTDLGFSTVGENRRSPTPIQNQEKTSGTLYSVFKEPDPRDHLPRPKTAPYRRRYLCQKSPEGRTSSISEPRSPVKRFSVPRAPARTRGDPLRPEKEPENPKGGAV